MATRIPHSATRPEPRAPGLVAAALVAAVAIGFALPGALRDAPPLAASLAPAALLVCIALVALAYLRPSVVVIAAFALSAIVRVEPAPTDLLLVIVAGVSLISGRLSIRLPPSRRSSIRGRTATGTSSGADPSSWNQNRNSSTRSNASR